MYRGRKLIARFVENLSNQLDDMAGPFNVDDFLSQLVSLDGCNSTVGWFGHAIHDLSHDHHPNRPGSQTQ